MIHKIISVSEVGGTSTVLQLSNIKLNKPLFQDVHALLVHQQDLALPKRMIKAQHYVLSIGHYGISKKNIIPSAYCNRTTDSVIINTRTKNLQDNKMSLV